MIKISIELYKYGSFRETFISEFVTRNQVLEFIAGCKDYDNYITEMSKRSGESCFKWTQKFTFEGVSYNFAADC